MPKLGKQPETPRFPSVRRKCKYCGCQFNTKATYNGSQMKFCSARHRKAFDKEGEKPIDVILRRQEQRMRKIAREEISAALDSALSRLRESPLVHENLQRMIRAEIAGEQIVPLDLETELARVAELSKTKSN